VYRQLLKRFTRGPDWSGNLMAVDSESGHQRWRFKSYNRRTDAWVLPDRDGPRLQENPLDEARQLLPVLSENSIEPESGQFQPTHHRVDGCRSIPNLVVRMARENRGWGYTRIQGALQNVGHRVCRTTISNIFKENGIDPAPERGKRTTWSQFLKAHWNVLAAADFFTVEFWAPRGLVTFYVFFVIELATRRIDIAGITPGPSEPWMMQIGRNLTDPVDGFLADKRFLIIDRDSKYSLAFRVLLKDARLEVVRLPYRSPNLNAYAERFVRSIKDECLNRMIFFGERSLRKATREYAAHYHRERNHQGIDNRLIEPTDRAESASSAIECAQRLGGMLRFYHRAAA